jgi:hypothetical protein
MRSLDQKIGELMALFGRVTPGNWYLKIPIKAPIELYGNVIGDSSTVICRFTRHREQCANAELIAKLHDFWPHFIICLTEFKNEIKERDARITTFEAQLAYAVAREREECAKVAPDLATEWEGADGPCASDISDVCNHIAARIRARSEREPT